MKFRLLSAFCVLSFAAATLPVTARAFDVADVLAAPFPDALVASGDGTVLVWKVDASGVRNLYTNAGGTVHALTHYTQDDGQDVFTPAVTAGNDAVIFFRGNAGDEGTAENANPLSLIPPAQRTLYVVPIAGGEPVKLADGSNAAFLSPKGNAVAFTTSQGQLGEVTFSKDTTGAFKAGNPEMLPIRGAVGDVAWSPDGATPAFTNDSVPAWSPDSSRVAFVRSPGAKIGETIYDSASFSGGSNAAFPWSIWVANATSGNAHKVWSAHNGIGDEFYPTMSAAQDR